MARPKDYEGVSLPSIWNHQAQMFSFVVFREDSKGADSISSVKVGEVVEHLVNSYGGSYWYILHDCDPSDDGDGTLKAPHYHIIFRFSVRRYLRSVYGDLCDCLAVKKVVDLGDGGYSLNPRVSFSLVVSLTPSLRYLVHLDEGEKTPYPVSEVSTNNIEVFSNAIAGVSGDFVNVDSLVKICQMKKTKIGVLKTLGVSNYNKCRYAIDVIMDALYRESIKKGR